MLHMSSSYVSVDSISYCVANFCTSSGMRAAIPQPKPNGPHPEIWSLLLSWSFLQLDNLFEFAWSMTFSTL